MTDILKPSPPDDGRLAIRHAGWDYLTVAPGTTDEVRCRVCGEQVEVRRGVVGPTGFAHAVAVQAGASRGRRHDVFSCPFSSEPWHRQALALKMAAAGTPSRLLEIPLRKEAEQVIRTRTATKGGLG